MLKVERPLGNLLEIVSSEIKAEEQEHFCFENSVQSCVNNEPQAVSEKEDEILGELHNLQPHSPQNPENSPENV